MARTIRERFRSSWNAFMSREPTFGLNSYGASYGVRPDRKGFTGGNKQSIVSSIYNQIAVDVAQVTINHSRLDENKKYKETIDSYLNECLTVEANIDQTGRAFRQDVVTSMLDEGSIAIVPVDTDINPNDTESYDVLSMRVGKIVAWYPEHVRVDLYDERTGQHREITLQKKFVCIIENPLYAIMNEPNSTLKRLIRKMNLLDYMDEQSSSGKLDMIIQLPYVIKTEARRKEAEKRTKDIQRQLEGSKYGIAYTDGTERIVQLNRSLENNLLAQIQYLTTQLYNQLGLTESVFNGTADEATMLNYYNRTIEPILSAMTDEMTRKFLSKTARSQGQAITFFRDPFRLVPTDKIAEIADKFTRNEILSTNEVRAIIGYKPVDDPRANELRNKNLNQSNDAIAPMLTNRSDEDDLDQPRSSPIEIGRRYLNSE